MRAAGPVLVLALAGLAACGRSGGAVTAPAEPEAAVRAFLSAVRANSLVALRELWGTARGPAVGSMDKVEVDRRLTVMRTYLEHESFQFAQRNMVDPADSRQRIVDVRLTRKGCEPVVPFTLVRWRSGWLVQQVDLAAAGNPARSCTPGRAPP